MERSNTLRLRHSYLSLILVLATLLSLTSVAVRLSAQGAGKAMKEDDIVGLLEAGVDNQKVGEAAQQFGIAFEMNHQTETRLRDAGADDTLIALLKRIAPKSSTTTPAKPKGTSGPPPPPPVLFIEVTPGGAHVYVDDEPIGTTSEAGRLRLTQLKEGSHTIRVSLAGYKDYEQSVDLQAGQTVNLTTTLAARAPVTPTPEPVNPVAGGGTPTEGTGGGGGSLGVTISNQAPAGGRGAYITAVQPGSPAERAGLRPGFTILSVNGQMIATPQRLLEIITNSRAGDYVQIAFNDGSRMQWTRAQLAPRANQASPSQTQPPAAGGLTGGTTNGSQPQRPAMPMASFNVMHDHGQSGQNYCSGVLTVGGGRVTYHGNNPAHTFDFGVDEIKEVKRNGVYLVALGAFHIRLKTGPNYNFVVMGAGGQAHSPDEVIRAIGMSMGQ